MLNEIAETTASSYAPESIHVCDLPQCPADYRQHLVRILSMQAYAERAGATELAKWIERAPDFRLRRVLSRILYDEANHSFLLYRTLDELGVSEDEAIALAEGRGNQGPTPAALAGPLAVGNDDNEWLDVILNNMFLDRAGRFMVENFSKSSYAPWAQACRRILKDELLHQGFGFAQFKKHIRHYTDRAHLARRTTYWYAHGLNFFGPPSSSKTELLARYGLKRKSNETLRLAFRQEVEQLLASVQASDLIQLNRHEYPYA